MADPDLLQEDEEASRNAAHLPRSASMQVRSAGTSAPEELGQLVRRATNEVTGCSGASATLWQDGEPVAFATSHPDLAKLATIERSPGGGPVAAALTAGGPVCSPDTLDEDRSPDTLDEDRWPAYAAAALACGVRSCVTLVHRSGPVVVTLSLFGVRPGQPGPDAIGS
jgi:hypothetical protein